MCPTAPVAAEIDPADVPTNVFTRARFRPMDSRTCVWLSEGVSVRMSKSGVRKCGCLCAGMSVHARIRIDTLSIHADQTERSLESERMCLWVHVYGGGGGGVGRVGVF